MILSYLVKNKREANNIDLRKLLKILLFSKSYPDPLSRTSLSNSVPNTIHHSRLTVCLRESLDLDTLNNDFLG